MKDNRPSQDDSFVSLFFRKTLSSNEEDEVEEDGTNLDTTPSASTASGRINNSVSPTAERTTGEESTTATTNAFNFVTLCYCFNKHVGEHEQHALQRKGSDLASESGPDFDKDYFTINKLMKNRLR